MSRKGATLDFRQRKALDLLAAHPERSMASIGVEAGYAPASASLSVRKLAASKRGKAYLAKKYGHVMRKLDISPERTIEALANFAYRSLARFKRVGPNGELSWDFTGATEEELELITGLTVEEYMEGRGKAARKVKRTKIAGVDRLRAIELLMKHQGLLKDVTVHEGEISLIARIAQARRRVGEERALLEGGEVHAEPVVDAEAEPVG